MSLITLQAQAAPLAPGEPAYALMRNAGTEQCLDSNEKGKVYTSRCWGPDVGQRWQRNGGVLRNMESHRCLDADVSTGIVYTSPCSIKDPGQAWHSFGSTQPNSGRYQNGQSGFYLDSNYYREVYTLPRNESIFQAWVSPV